MQAVLGEQHMRQQPRPGAAARDRVRRRRRLGDLLAAPARELLAHVLDHLPLARHQLQRLGHVLAQLVQGAAAARAGRRSRIDDALARQMLGQRPARRLAPRRSACTATFVGALASSRSPPRPAPASSSSSNSCSSSWSSSARRSDDWPNRSCRSLAIVCFSFSISAHAPGFAADLARASAAAAPRAAADHRLQRLDVVGQRFSGGASRAPLWQHRATRCNRLLARPSRHVASPRRLRPPRPLRQPPVDALPADSRAAPA